MLLTFFGILITSVVLKQNYIFKKKKYNWNLNLIVSDLAIRKIPTRVLL